MTRPQLEAAEPKALAEIIGENGWQGEPWTELCNQLALGESKETAVRQILLQWNKQVKETLNRLKEEVLLRKKQKAALEHRKEGKKIHRVPSRFTKAPRPVVRKTIQKKPKCTCGCPTHTERCKLFNPRFSAYQHFPHRDPRVPPPPAGAHSDAKVNANTPAPLPLSEWARKQVLKISSDILKLPKADWKGAYRKQMLLYHPDKRLAPDNPFVGKNEEEVAEVFMELKRRYDRAHVQNVEQ